jgi:hypothetical protein
LVVAKEEEEPTEEVLVPEEIEVVEEVVEDEVEEEVEEIH